MRNNQFLQHQKQITNYSNGEPFISSLSMNKEGEIEYYYSPFEYVNTTARIVLVGMSPGATQANNANIAARDALAKGHSIDEALKIAKETGSFSGALRNNLVAMLDHIGVSKKIGIDSASSLFAENASLLHSTSVFRFPILLKGKPISSAKAGLKHPILKGMIDDYLADECSLLSKETLYIPLGQGVSEVLHYLADKGVISASQILTGLPHPSGANAERISYFLGRKERRNLSAKTNPDKLNSAKQELLTQLSA
jgi:hypothetical protein